MGGTTLMVTTKGNQRLGGICFPLEPGAGFLGTSRRRVSVSKWAIKTGIPFSREPGQWVVQFFGLAAEPSGGAPATATVVVRVEAGLPEESLWFGRYSEHLPGDNSVSGLAESKKVEACQYSMAPFDTKAFPGLRLKGRAVRVNPEQPLEAVEMSEVATLPTQEVTLPTDGILMMAMWYPIVLAQGFKRPTCRGLDAIGRVDLSRAVLEAWVAACPNAPNDTGAGDTGAGLAESVNVELKRLVAPLGTFATYRGEVRNHWQNPLLVRAASGQKAEVDCEDFAWAAVDLLRSLKEHPGALGSKFPQLARLKWSSAEPFLVSGHVYKKFDRREAHMWTGLRCGDRYHFVEAVCGDTYAASGDPFARPLGSVTYRAVRFFFSDCSGWPRRDGRYAPKLNGGRLEVAYDNARKSNLKAKAIDYPGKNVHWFTVSDPAKLGLTAAVRAETSVVTFPSRAAAAAPAVGPAAGRGRDWVAAPPS